jgi:glyoxylate reductase
MQHKPKIFITRQFPGPAVELLRDRYDVVINESDRVLSKAQLMRRVRGVDVIVSLLTDAIDSEVMDAAGDQLRLIANYAIGYDNIDLQAAAERDIVVTNTPGQLAASIGEHTIALMLAVARRIVEADAFTKAHKYRQWEPALLMGQEMRGKTLGIVGLGRIGQSVVEIAQAMGMRVMYADEIRTKAIEKSHNVSYHSFEYLVEHADVLSLHVPLLPTTHHLINRHVLARMKPTAILINTARGPVVEERALIHALKTGQIYGAGLDVFEHEPIVSDALAALPNVVLTPHIASSTIEARTEMSQLVADNVMALLEEGKAITPVTLFSAKHQSKR